MVLNRRNEIAASLRSAITVLWEKDTDHHSLQLLEQLYASTIPYEERDALVSQTTDISSVCVRSCNLAASLPEKQGPIVCVSDGRIRDASRL